MGINAFSPKEKKTHWQTNKNTSIILLILNFCCPASVVQEIIKGQQRGANWGKRGRGRGKGTTPTWELRVVITEARDMQTLETVEVKLFLTVLIQVFTFLAYLILTLVAYGASFIFIWVRKVMFGCLLQVCVHAISLI